PFATHAPQTSYTYTLSLHDALPISISSLAPRSKAALQLSNSAKSAAYITRVLPDISVTFKSSLVMNFAFGSDVVNVSENQDHWRSEEHTSELQSREHLVCRLLLEKK